jgi:hypothetical protein
MDGTSNLIFQVVYSANLSLVIKHRNHLGIMSGNPVEDDNGIYQYDFTLSGDQAFGSNSQNQLQNEIYGMVCGDANSDGTINSQDLVGSWNLDSGKHGFLNSDLNGDGQSDNRDKNEFWIKNLGRITNVPN